MDKIQASVEKELLNHEKEVYKQLKKSYTNALADVKARVKMLQANIDSLQGIDITGYDDKQIEILKSQIQSKIYQLEYQKTFERQVSSIIDVLKQDTISNVQGFLGRIYQDSYLGILYDINSKGIPITTPINPDNMVKVVNKKIESMTYADRINVNMNDFKKTIKAEISRGIASGSSYNEIANNLSMVTGEDLYKSRRIIRTEGSRVSTEAKLNSIKNANKNGADLVKQWDSTLDGKTRETHAKLDQQWVELDEPFKVDGYETMGPGLFGDPSQDCNCRCVLLSVPRWDIDDTIVKLDNETKESIEVKNYQDWKKEYYVKLEKSNDNKTKIKEINLSPAYKKLTDKEIDNFQNSSNIAYNNFTKSNKEAMDEYTMGGYLDINDYLNGKFDGFDNIDDFINDIDDAISKYSLEEDIITYRGTSKEYYNDLRIGDEFTISMYSSTSLNENIAKTFFEDKKNPLLLEILIPKETPCIYIGDNTAYEFEAELLLKRGLKYRVLDIKDDKIVVEVIK